MVNVNTSNLFTAGKIAESTGISGAKVKKAIVELKIKPSAIKGKCAYYDDAAIKKIKAMAK